MKSLLSYLGKPKAEFRPLCVHLPEDLYIRLKSQCAADRVSLKTMVCRALSQYLADKEATEPFPADCGEKDET